MFRVEHAFAHKNLDCVVMHLGTHRCGYVGVPKDHPLYGKSYKEADEKYDIYAHGGLTFSESNSKYPIEKKDTWWFGYDCAHAGDTLSNCSLDYCIKECEFLANSLDEVAIKIRQQKIKSAASDAPPTIKI